MSEEELTILQYVEQVGAEAGVHPDECQPRIDSILHAILHMPNAPRVYEVTRDLDGNPSLIWAARTRAEWRTLMQRVASFVLIGGAG